MFRTVWLAARRFFFVGPEKGSLWCKMSCLHPIPGYAWIWTVNLRSRNAGRALFGLFAESLHDGSSFCSFELSLSSIPFSLLMQEFNWAAGTVCHTGTL